MSVAVQDILVRKNVVVNAPREHVFRTFTERFDTWWPRSHHVGEGVAFTAILEPRAGGRWYERDEQGRECHWGSVLAWEPPERVLLQWDLGSDFKPQPGLGTEVEVRFVAEAPERTRVLLEHRKLERYGDKAQMMRALFDSENAWQGILAEFAKAAQA